MSKCYIQRMTGHAPSTRRRYTLKTTWTDGRQTHGAGGRTGGCLVLPFPCTNKARRRQTKDIQEQESSRHLREVGAYEDTYNEGDILHMSG